MVQAFGLERKWRSSSMSLVQRTPLCARSLLSLFALVLLIFTVTSAFASSTTNLAQLHVTDLDGHRHTLTFETNQAALVLVFISVECPISNSYAPELQRLAREFGPKHVRFELVYPNADETAAAVRKHMEEFALPFLALRDPKRDLVNLAKVHITPEAAVFVPNGGLVYHGRIDNRYADLGVARPEATEHDLRDVLTAIVNGKPVPHSSTRAIGCSIAPH
jgi:hypothetical protein